jgi:hypothetical protein
MHLSDFLKLAIQVHWLEPTGRNVQLLSVAGRSGSETQHGHDKCAYSARRLSTVITNIAISLQR